MLSDLQPGQTVSLDPAEARHARKALRLGPGQTVTLFDARGVTATARLDDRAGDGPGLGCVIVERTEHPPPAATLTLAVALPKAGRVDDMVDGLVQLGVDRLIPLRTERSVVAPRQAKLERLSRRVIEAMKQCGRAHAMAIGPLTPLKDVLVEPAETRLLLAPGGDRGGAFPSGGSVLALIGPEGGWAEAESAAAVAAGFEPWTVGPHVLRIETAAVAAAALLRYAR